MTAGWAKSVLVPRGAQIADDTRPEAALARVRDVETHLLAVDPSKTHLPGIFKAVNELKKHYEFTISLPK